MEPTIETYKYVADEYRQQADIYRHKLEQIYAQIKNYRSSRTVFNEKDAVRAIEEILQFLEKNDV